MTNNRTAEKQTNTHSYLHPQTQTHSSGQGKLLKEQKNNQGKA